MKRARSHWTLVGAILVLLATGTADGQQPDTGPTGDAVAPPDSVSIAPRAQDDEIERRLERILGATGWFASESVAVREGVVFLDGTTATQEHRQWAGTLASKTDDVVAVVNRITVQPPDQWDLSPAWNEVQRILVSGARALPLVLFGLGIIVLTWIVAGLVARLVRWAARDRIASPLMLSLTARAISIPILILGVYLVLQISGLTRLALTVLGGTGLAGVIIGFAFRDIAENFLASLLLSVRNPFRAGDLIRIGEFEGIVNNLNTRSTVLLTIDGNHVQIPNATVFKSVITNFSSNPSRRAEFLVGIGYDDSTSKAQEIIEGVLKAHSAVREEPSPYVVVDELAASTVNLKVFFWFDSETYSPAKLRSALMRQTKRALLDGGISMPDEAREVIFPHGLPVYRAEPPARAAAMPSPAPAEPSVDRELDTSRAEGGLENEDEELLREVGAVKTPEERENLLAGTDTRSASHQAADRRKNGDET